MKNIRISTVTRVLLFMCGLGLLSVLFLPIWRIDLQAPQYPEGLRLLIYASKLAGNVDIINGLNHYIGMKTLHADDFPEFKILPAIIIFFAIFFMIAGILAKRKWVNILCLVFILFGIFAMVDFWRWEYDYGHNLDPAAAIIVPGMAYQPPLIGFKQLLNFGAFSIPDKGGWTFVAVGCVLLSCVLFEWRKRRKQAVQTTLIPSLIATMLIFLIGGCSVDPQPIRLGKDNCYFCKMAFSDNRFGAELITHKSKVYKFDDEHCIIAFMKSDKTIKQQIAGIYFVDFMYPHQLLNVNQAIFFQSPAFKSPMNGNIAAFTNEDSLVKILPGFAGNKVSWEDMQK